jgi:hypothetical protein
MAPIRFSENSVNNNQYTLHKVPKSEDFCNKSLKDLFPVKHIKLVKTPTGVPISSIALHSHSVFIHFF